jgi:cytochrome b561
MTPSAPGATVARYRLPAQALHWFTAVLVVAAFVTGLGGSEARVYAVARDGERQLHETLGLTVFALTLLRVLWRLAVRPPEVSGGPLWMQRMAKAVQGALYLLLVLVPVSAICGAWLEGHPLLIAGVGPVPPPVGASKAVGEALSVLHPWLGDAIVWLAGLHALAALFHHVVLRDGVLRAMLPGR